MARRTYETEAIRVHWDSGRCIHTAICLQRLPEVFDVQARPWVDVRGADADAIAETIERCPTGALRYERLDGAEGEQPRRPTTVLPIEDGPLLMVGDLLVKDPDGEEITHEGRLTLCRCGMSRNQPFCDNSHLRRGWRSGPSQAPAEQPPAPEPGDEDRPTEIVPRQDASLKLRGDLRIYYRRGERPARAGKALLCRCGQSANKPFCDGSHKTAGFRSKAPEPPRDRLEAETPAAFTRNRRVPDPERAAADEAGDASA